MHRNILILEDNIFAMKNIYRIIEELNREVIIYTACDIKDAYDISMKQHIHLFIVDIILNPKNNGDVSGIKFVQEIRNVKRYEFIPVIFLTSLQDPKLYSYSQLGCMGYIEKPFDDCKVKKYILKALHFPVPTDKDRFVYFRKEGIVYSKCVSEICFIEVSRRKVIIYCEDDKLEIPYKTCSEILEELGSPSFVQCNRKSIVNRDYIEQIDYTRRLIKLKNMNKTIEIGPVMKDKFKLEIEKPPFLGE